jgi:SAM-dependent methyltransferase
LLRRCPTCGFVFVEDPDPDISDIYTLEYYQGRGADCLIDYEFEWANPRTTVRQFEWQGIAAVVGAYKVLGPGIRVLDFGCGNGAFVNWLRTTYGCSVTGYENGLIADVARSRGVPIVHEQDLELENQFDAVTAIEVFEHVTDPLAVLAIIRRVLKPGGLLFFTTGNVAKVRGPLAKWDYIQPEFHISFYEPRTIKRAFQSVGLRPIRTRFSAGYASIIKFKMLKRLRVRTVSPILQALPWGTLTRVADWQFGVSAFPIGLKPRIE